MSEDFIKGFEAGCWTMALIFLIVLILLFNTTANAALTPCQQFCIDNWLQGNGPKNHQSCNFVGFAQAANPNCYLDRPTIQDANTVAIKWLTEE